MIQLVVYVNTHCEHTKRNKNPMKNDLSFRILNDKNYRFVLWPKNKKKCETAQMCVYLYCKHHLVYVNTLTKQSFDIVGKECVYTCTCMCVWENKNLDEQKIKFVSNVNTLTFHKLFFFFLFFVLILLFVCRRHLCVKMEKTFT